MAQWQLRHDLVRKALRYVKDETFSEKIELQEFIMNSIKDAELKYSSHLVI